MPRPWARELRHFWFETLSPQDVWQPTEALDDELRRRFGHWWHALRRRPAAEFVTDAHGALAAAVLFDQIPRNLFRRDARAYATDPLARAIARRAVATGLDRALSREERQFLFMPFMHSERIADQLLALRLFRPLGRRYGWPFARAHYRAVARFGRFPHRNAVLGRDGTAAERRAVENGMAW